MITLGLLLASLIVGATLLMQVRTTFTILGNPRLARPATPAHTSVGLTRP